LLGNLKTPGDERGRCYRPVTMKLFDLAIGVEAAVCLEGVEELMPVRCGKDTALGALSELERVIREVSK
jgi:hypothetical protein